MVIQLATIGYVAAGTIFAAAFLARGLTAVDPAARDAGLAFRAILIPGVVGLWPYLLIRWVRSR